MKALALHENFTPNEYILISIRNLDSDEDLDFFTNRYKDVLSLRFDDIKEQSSKGISYGHIMHLNRFIEKYKNMKFIIHCEWGISRSAAIGMHIERELLGVEYEDSKINEHWRYEPNPYMLEILKNPKL